METPLQKKSSVHRLAIAFWISMAGFVLCVITPFCFGMGYGWVESQRVQPTPNPVYYAAVLEDIHHVRFWMMPLLGGLFLLIAITTFLLWRDAKRFT